MKTHFAEKTTYLTNVICLSVKKMCRPSGILAEATSHRENTFRRKDYLPRRQMLYVTVSKKLFAEVVSLPRRPTLCRRDDQNAADVSKIFRRRVKGFRRRIQNILPTRLRISPTRPKYFADASKDFADASKIFRRRVQGFRRRVQRFHRRRGNAADATNYHVYSDFLDPLHYVAAPKLWNSCPKDERNCTVVGVFKSKLETILV